MLNQILDKLAKNKTWKQVADESGYCYETIRKWRRGKATPRMFAVETLAEVAGLSIEVEINGTVLRGNDLTLKMLLALGRQGGDEEEAFGVSPWTIERWVLNNQSATVDAFERAVAYAGGTIRLVEREM